MDDLKLQLDDNGKEMSQEWIEECMRFHGRVLTGKYRHWCYDWDELPLDETCEEFQCCCTCFGKEAPLTPVEFVLNQLPPQNPQP